MNLTEKEKEVILGFANGNMNIGECARLMYVHRNTVYYYFGKIKEKAGLDPQNFYDLCELVEKVNREDKNVQQTD